MKSYGLGTLLLAVIGASWIHGVSSTLAIAGGDVTHLEAQMRALQAQMSELQRQVDKARAEAAAAQEAADAGGKQTDLEVNWKGAPEFSSPKDGGKSKYKLKIRGRIMADYNTVNQPADKIQERGDHKKRRGHDIDGVELRRARLGVEGHVFYDWKYKFEVDFAGDDTSIKDAYVAYAPDLRLDLRTAEARAGNSHVHNSLEQVTSSRFITFLERAAFTKAFNLDRQIGAGVVLGGDFWSFQTGYYGSTVEDQGTWYDDPTAFAIRGTVAPINRDGMVVHLGASYRDRTAGAKRGGDDDKTLELFRYRARGADLHLADSFVETPNLADEDDMFVIEGAIVAGPFSVQGEYAQLEPNVPAHLSQVSSTYNGWYVDASWFLTGETRNYRAKSGSFGRVKVNRPLQLHGHNRGWGAFQIAGRYDVLDLRDNGRGFHKYSYVNCEACSKQGTWLLGLNWWPTDYTALKFQYSESKIDGGKYDGEDVKGLGVRAQVDW
ncbi:MAG: OprO/OprP family phosphate-selective porin [Hyphomicrobiaceae bacterium]